MCLPSGSVVKNMPANAGDAARDLGLSPGLGRSPEEGNGNPIQYSCLENSMEKTEGLQPMGSQTGHNLATEHARIILQTHFPLKIKQPHV